MKHALKLLFFAVLLNSVLAQSLYDRYPPQVPHEPPSQPFEPDRPPVDPTYPWDPRPNLPEPSVSDLMMLIERYEARISRLEERIQKLEKENEALRNARREDTCESGLGVLQKAYSRYLEEGGEQKPDGGRTLYAEMFSKGWLDFVPGWYSQVFLNQNGDLKCRDME